MAWVYFNPNPWGLNTDDCTVRALCAVLGMGWDEAHELLSDTSRKMGLMPSNKNVMLSILMREGFRHEQLPDLCPDCYTVEDFAADHPHGLYVLATDTHILTVAGGNWLDAWDSGREVPVNMWKIEYQGRRKQ